MQSFALIHCCMCGINFEMQMPIAEAILIPEVAAIKRIEANTSWSYAEPTDEWMCRSCSTSPALFKVTKNALKKLECSANKPTWAWNELVKKEIMAQLNIDPDAVLANEVEVKAYMNPHSFECDFYISPIGTTWIELKKRHPATKSKTWGNKE